MLNKIQNGNYFMCNIDVVLKNYIICLVKTGEMKL
jgi:hypothetical protein